MRRARRAALVAILVGAQASFVALFVGSTACKSKPKPAPPSTLAPLPSGSGTAARIERASLDRAWIEARGGDALELARLADALGADALAEVASSEEAASADRDTAVRALAHCDEPTAALSVLVDLALDGASGERGLLALQTLATLAPRRAPVEQADPDAWSEAARRLTANLASITEPTRRELVLSILVSLDGRVPIERAKLPAR
jgi:hypothetical protein